MLAAIFMLAVWQPAHATDKDDMAVAPPPSHFEPAASGQNLLDPKLFKFSRTAPTYDTGKMVIERFEKEAPGVTLPTTIDLGKSMLRFDTSRNPGTRVGIDEKDPALLNPGIPVRKDSPLTPSYFGLTLTAPIH